ncbi:sulfite exporter TauE/SafE family protein [Pendulispora rubella]|uniref:Probable membrane transporter protein n=1 Tax=Pendulispora rubella TaxID=2741070 RepID=A0ABZ2L9X5_9BACT
MTIAQGALLFAVATVAGALNSVAGGGSFLTFPALIFAGVPPVIANATNSVAVWPGGVAGAFAYRTELHEMRRELVALSASSFLGGLVGALLLLRTSDAAFMGLVPWLLLAATSLFSFGGIVTQRVRSFSTGAPVSPHAQLGSLVAVQFVIGVYGGYFGGGMGIMMLASLAVMGMTRIHAMNALKTVLTTVINGIAIVAFIAAGKIAWGYALLMAIGATGGGYMGAFAARMSDPKWMRRFILLVAWAMTAWFFVKQYGAR